MEIKNKLTVTTGEEVGKSRERRGRVKSRNMYKGPMDTDKGGRKDWMWEVGRTGKSNGGKMGTTVIEQQ